MDFSYQPTNVIYNTFSPNKNKCINPDAKSSATVTFLPIQQRILEYIGEKPEIFGFPERPMPSQWARKSTFHASNWMAPPRVIRSRSHDSKLPVPPVRRAPQPKPVDTGKRLEVENEIKKYLPRFLAKDLVKYARELSTMIRVPYMSSLKEATVIWFIDNFDKIKPLLPEVHRKLSDRPM